MHGDFMYVFLGCYLPMLIQPLSKSLATKRVQISTLQLLVLVTLTMFYHTDSNLVEHIW